MTLPSDKDLEDLRPRLLRRARRYADCHAEAEDLAQEALLRVWLRLQADAPVVSVERYLFITLRNLAKNRRPQPLPLTEADMPTSHHAADGRLAVDAVLRALGQLPSNQAKLIRERAIGGHSYSALAQRHDLPPGTVMSRVSRGRAKLCDQLELPRNAPVSALLGRS